MFGNLFSERYVEWWVTTTKLLAHLSKHSLIQCRHNIQNNNYANRKVGDQVLTIKG